MSAAEMVCVCPRIIVGGGGIKLLWSCFGKGDVGFVVIRCRRCLTFVLEVSVKLWSYLLGRRLCHAKV